MTTSSAFWDKIAPKYAKDPIADQAAYDYTLDRTRSYLKRTDKVLELGCGTGSTALLLAPNVGHITATDISGGMIAIAQEKVDAAGVQNMACAVETEVPQDGPYDAILGFNLFHLVPDLERSLAQIHAQLPVGGYFISKTPCLKGMGLTPKGIMISAFILFGIPLMQLVGKAPYVRRLSVPELEAAISKAGFEIVETGNHPKGPPPSRYIVARKV